MGGKVDRPAASDSSLSGDEESFLDHGISRLPPQNPSRLRNGEEGGHGSLYENSNVSSGGFPPTGLDFDVNQRRSQVAYQNILKSYDTQVSEELLSRARNRILSYRPGAWIEEVGGSISSDYDVPRTTSLLLIGPKGSGKSSLVNRISKVFEDDDFTLERAQVTFNTVKGDGTYFLGEYMIPRGSTSFCLYDTRSWSTDAIENAKMLKRWMMKGARHGKLVTWKSDDPELRKRMKYKARLKDYSSCEIRSINFVIFVVDGLSVLKSMEGKDDEACSYMDMAATMFNLPFLSFRDDRPVVVVTHCDMLSVSERASVRVYLGKRLGIPPTKQIFDIPESSDPLTELTIVNMIRYSLEHADRNLSHKNIWFSKKVCKASTKLIIFWFLIMLGLAIVAITRHHRPHHRFHKSHPHIDWPSIRHMWVGLMSRVKFHMGRFLSRIPCKF